MFLDKRNGPLGGPSTKRLLGQGARGRRRERTPSKYREIRAEGPEGSFGGNAHNSTGSQETDTTEPRRNSDATRTTLADTRTNTRGLAPDDFVERDTW